VPEEFERLPRDVELALFRVVQEGWPTCGRHSRSATRHSSWKSRTKLVGWRCGTPAPASAEKLARMKNQTGELGVGIAGMHERLHQLGGRLESNQAREAQPCAQSGRRSRPAQPNR